MKKWVTRNLLSWHKVLSGWHNADRIVNRVGDPAIHLGRAAASGTTNTGDDALLNCIVATFLTGISMYFKQKSNVMFRNYESFGYITDNRNFGYQKADNSGNDIGDKIVSHSGTVFLSVLSTKPQAFDDVAQKISEQFPDVDLETIKTDAIEFYGILELDGFIVSGETAQECDAKDFHFSYNNSTPQNIVDDGYLSNTTPKKTSQEFLDEYFKNEQQLTNLHIEITSKCNERCVHCYIPQENRINHIESQLFYNILKQCKDMNVLHLTLTGGEPMLHKDFVNFLRKSKEYNFSINVLSNLTLLTDEIVHEMKTNPLLSVQVSLYSMDPKVHDSITRTKGSFEITKRAILKLKENDVPLQISCPVIKQNKQSYKKVAQWAETHKLKAACDYVVIAKCNNTTQNLNYRLSMDELKEFIQEKIINEPDYLKFIRSESENKKSASPDDAVCSVCHSSVCISDDGNVYPCAGWQGYVVGNVNVTALKDIWSNSEKIRYLRGLRKRDFTKCMECPEKRYCTMCMVRNANEHHLGDPLVVNDFFCNVAKLYREMAEKS